MSDDVRSIIRNYLEERRLARRGGTVADSAQPGPLGQLDSLAMMELVLFIETRFEIEFSSHDLDRRKLDTLEQIEQLVLGKRAPADSRADALKG